MLCDGACVEAEQVGDGGGEGEFAGCGGLSAAGELSESAAVFEVGVDGFDDRAASPVLVEAG